MAPILTLWTTVRQAAAPNSCFASWAFLMPLEGSYFFTIHAHSLACAGHPHRCLLCPVAGHRNQEPGLWHGCFVIPAVFRQPLHIAAGSLCKLPPFSGRNVVSFGQDHIPPCMPLQTKHAACLRDASGSVAAPTALLFRLMSVVSWLTTAFGEIKGGVSLRLVTPFISKHDIFSFIRLLYARNIFRRTFA